MDAHKILEAIEDATDRIQKAGFCDSADRDLVTYHIAAALQSRGILPAGVAKSLGRGGSRLSAADRDALAQAYVGLCYDGATPEQKTAWLRARGLDVRSIYRWIQSSKTCKADSVVQYPPRLAMIRAYLSRSPWKTGAEILGEIGYYSASSLSRPCFVRRKRGIVWEYAINPEWKPSRQSINGDALASSMLREH